MLDSSKDMGKGSIRIIRIKEDPTGRGILTRRYGEIFLRAIKMFKVGILVFFM